MNTRKDYWRAVRIIRTVDDPMIRATMASAFIAFFSKDNPRFDADRFVNAVNAPESTKEAMPRTAWDVVL